MTVPKGVRGYLPPPDEEPVPTHVSTDPLGPMVPIMSNSPKQWIAHAGMMLRVVVGSEVTGIYVVVIDDRHVDLDVELYADFETAITAAENAMREIVAHPEHIDWPEPVTEAALIAGGEWRAQYQAERDNVRVIARELETS